LGVLGVPAFLLEAGAGGLVVAAAETGDLAGDFHDLAALGGGVEPCIRRGLEGATEREGERGGKPAGGDFEVGDGFEVGAFFSHELKHFSGLLELEPFLVAALLPFAEILFGDGASAEVFVQHALHFGEGV
jgi:hypothetical protein